METVECSKSLASTMDIDLRCDVSPLNEKIYIFTDRTKIIQIVSNLVNNAIKFTKKGAIEVSFRLCDTAQDSLSDWGEATAGYSGHIFTVKQGEVIDSLEAAQRRVVSLPNFSGQKWISVSIKDTGCGMDPEELVEMLQPYTQSSSGTNRVFQGTGLGLFICVSLCHQLSGFLACASTPDVGTIFHIGIPVDLDETNGALCGDHGSEDEPLERIPVSGPLLIVDDNKVNVKILHRSLQLELKKIGLEKIELIAADGGAAAIELYKRRKPSVCFIDFHMPEVDGIAATKAIRQYEFEMGLNPAYIFSNTADATDEANMLLTESGVNEIMLKPPPKGFLHKIVSRLEPLTI